MHIRRDTYVAFFHKKKKKRGIPPPSFPNTEFTLDDTAVKFEPEGFSFKPDQWSVIMSLGEDIVLRISA